MSAYSKGSVLFQGMPIYLKGSVSFQEMPVYLKGIVSFQGMLVCLNCGMSFQEMPVYLRCCLPNYFHTNGFRQKDLVPSMQRCISIIRDKEGENKLECLNFGPV